MDAIHRSPSFEAHRKVEGQCSGQCYTGVVTNCYPLSWTVDLITIRLDEPMQVGRNTLTNISFTFDLIRNRVVDNFGNGTIALRHFEPPYTAGDRVVVSNLDGQFSGVVHTCRISEGNAIFLVGVELEDGSNYWLRVNEQGEAKHPKASIRKV